MVTGARISVVIAIPGLDRGGPDKVFFNLATGLPVETFSTTVVTVEPRGHYLERLPARVPAEAMQTGSARLLTRYPVVPLARFVRRHRPDVVLTTLRMDLAALAGRVAWPRTTRLVVRPANHPSANSAELAAARSLGRWATPMARAYRWADAVICQSEVVRSDMAALGVPQERMTVIGNGIDVDEARRRVGEARQLPGVPALLGVGRLMPQKGFDLVVAAMNRVRDRFPTAELTIAGDGPARRELEEMVRLHRLDGVVHFAGHVDEPLAWMTGADIFVLSSRYEGFANVVLESLACGTPVVAARGVSGIRGTVIDGQNGWLADDGEPEALAQAMLRGCEKYLSVDRDAVVQRCRTDHSIQKMTDAYATLLRGEAGRAKKPWRHHASQIAGSHGRAQPTRHQSG